MQKHFINISSLDGWSFYRPDHLVEEGDPHLNVYGVVFSTTDKTDFDVLLNRFRAIEIENPFQIQNELPFTSLITLDMRNWSPCFIDNIAKKKKMQSVLVNCKPKVSTFMKEKWECERLEWRAKVKKHSEQYKNRLMTDKDFAKRVEEKRKAEYERQK
jgi:hypothetical protein